MSYVVAVWFDKKEFDGGGCAPFSNLPLAMAAFNATCKMKKWPTNAKGPLKTVDYDPETDEHWWPTRPAPTGSVSIVGVELLDGDLAPIKGWGECRTKRGRH